MEPKLTISVLANFLGIAGLILYGFTLFAEYHARGRWAKNITALLAGLGMMTLALALVFTPQNAEVIERIAETGASRVLVGISSVLLLAAIAAFGIITYSKPLRLWHERKIESDLNRELPKIP
jgi:drug/metabolite transporter (DMT)-like permease